jgi:hypothetical protein
MNVSYGFPQNTFSLKHASKISTNDGSLAPATGLKLYVAAAAVPVADVPLTPTSCARLKH